MVTDIIEAILLPLTVEERPQSTDIIEALPLPLTVETRQQSTNIIEAILVHSNIALPFCN